MMNDLMIADVTVRQDEHGRFCLNDLHRAAGGQPKHRPSLWIESKRTQRFLAALAIAGIPAIVSKQGVGTFVAQDAVYDYAMWIDPDFNVRVIRAYHDQMKAPAPLALPSYPEALRQLADAYEREAINAPKVRGFDRIADASGSHIFREAAKVLKMAPSDLAAWTEANGWCYRTKRTTPKSQLLANEPVLAAGFMRHALTQKPTKDGKPRKPGEPVETWTQARFTPKGIREVARILAEREIAALHPQAPLPGIQ